MGHSAVVPVNQPLLLSPAQQIGEVIFGIFDRIKLIALTCLQQIGKALSYLFSTLKNIVEPLPPAVKGVAMVGGSIALVVLFISRYFSKQKLKKVEPLAAMNVPFEFDKIKRLKALLKDLRKKNEEEAIEDSKEDELWDPQAIIKEVTELCSLVINWPQLVLNSSEQIAKETTKIGTLLAEASRLLDEIDRGEEAAKKTAALRSLLADVTQLLDKIGWVEEDAKQFAEFSILLQSHGIHSRCNSAA